MLYGWYVGYVKYLVDFGFVVMDVLFVVYGFVVVGYGGYID